MISSLTLEKRASDLLESIDEEAALRLAEEISPALQAHRSVDIAGFCLSCLASIAWRSGDSESTIETFGACLFALLYAEMDAIEEGDGARMGQEIG